jgi:hypothetical protein
MNITCMSRSFIDRTLRLEPGEKVHLLVSTKRFKATYHGITKTFSRDFNIWGEEEDVVLRVSLFVGGTG